MSKLFFYDLETTGVKHWKNGIHQISGRIVIDGEIKEEFDIKTQPNPLCTIESDALEIAGVTIEDLESYIPFNEAYYKVIAIVSKYVDKYKKTDKFHLVGYNNSSFDNHFFRAFFVQNAKTPQEIKFGNYFGSWFWSDSVDVMVLASNFLMKEREKMIDFKLKTVAQYLGIEVEEEKLHDALYDIHLTHEIYKKIS